MRQPKAHLLQLDAYVGGESTIKASDKPVVRLTSNEGALGSSPHAIEAYKRIAHDLGLYPKADAKPLREALATHTGADAARIVCGNGSDELIALLCHAYAGAGDEVLYSRHGFLMYKLAAQAAGATPVAVEEQKLTTDVDALIAAITPRTKLIFLANPNNPTGTYVGRQALEKLVAAIPDHALLVLDGAYREYATAHDYDDGIRFALNYPNVAVMGTFSKLYALAAVRLGWGIFPADVVAILHRARMPFNVNAAAQAAGIAALADQDHVRAVVAHNTRWRELLFDELPSLGFELTPSQANFVLMHTREHTQAMYEHLAAHGVFVRPVAAYGLPDALRVTIGASEAMDAFLTALKQYRPHG